MVRRPWPIVILAVSQAFFEPFNNIFMNSRLSHVSAQEYLSYFVGHGEWLSLFYILGLPIVMGAAVYAMKKWSYAVFALGATWMLIENFEQVHSGQMPLSVALALYLGNLGFVGYFLLPQVHAPFMNPKLRWWESKPRFIVDWPCRVASDTPESVSGRVEDYSEGGVFAVFDQPLEGFQTGTMQSLRIGVRAFNIPDEILSVWVKVVFSRPSGTGRGYGFQFVETDVEIRRKFKRISRDLKKSGAPFRYNREGSWASFVAWGKRLLTTGRGLLPDVGGAPQVKKALPPAESAEDNSKAAS
jgi:hypothetical protein